MSRFSAALILIAIVFWVQAADVGDDATRAADEATLKESNVEASSPALLEFFRKRTLSDAEQSKLSDTVRRLGDNSFSIREKASNDLLAAGRTALPFVRPAMRDPDLEVARRSQRIVDAIESGTGTALALAAARLLAHRNPPDAAKVLLNYLPFADNDAIEDEILNTLTVVGIRDSKAVEPLVDGLTDKSVLKRSAAAMVVGQSPQSDQRKLVKSLLKDSDSRVRLRAAQGLVQAKEVDGIPVLIGVLNDSPVALAWQAEEVLCRIAGENSPQVSIGAGSDEDRRKSRDAWNGWWKTNEHKLDLARLELEKRMLGLTLVVVYDGYANGQGRVWEFGSDRKPRWSIDADLQGPIDGVTLPGNRVLIAEYNAQRVTERDFKGKILWQHRVNGNPVACQRLPNGNTFIATLSNVIEVSKDGKDIYNLSAQQSQVTFAQKLRNGNIMFISSSGQLTEMDDKGKIVKTLKVGGNNTEWLTFEMLPGGRFLVAQQSQNKLVEYDSTGRVVWSGSAPSPYSATRLPNGNTIACSMNGSTVFEVDRAGKVLWTDKLQGRPFRVARR